MYLIILHLFNLFPNIYIFQFVPLICYLLNQNFILSLIHYYCFFIPKKIIQYNIIIIIISIKKYHNIRLNIYQSTHTLVMCAKINVNESKCNTCTCNK